MNDLDIAMALFAGASIVLNFYQYYELSKLQEESDNKTKTINVLTKQNEGFSERFVGQTVQLHKQEQRIRELEARAHQHAMVARENHVLRATVQRYQERYSETHLSKAIGSATVEAFADRAVNPHLSEEYKEQLLNMNQVERRKHFLGEFLINRHHPD